MDLEMKEIDLYAPDDSPIIGMKRIDGTYTQVGLKYCKDSKLVLFTVKEPNGIPIFKDESGENILKDIHGKEWLSSDVEFYSLGRR